MNIRPIVINDTPNSVLTPSVFMNPLLSISKMRIESAKCSQLHYIGIRDSRIRDEAGKDRKFKK